MRELWTAGARDPVLWPGRTCHLCRAPVTTRRLVQIREGPSCHVGSMGPRQYSHSGECLCASSTAYCPPPPTTHTVAGSQLHGNSLSNVTLPQRQCWLQRLFQPPNAEADTYTGQICQLCSTGGFLTLSPFYFRDSVSPGVSSPCI